MISNDYIFVNNQTYSLSELSDDMKIKLLTGKGLTKEAVRKLVETIFSEEVLTTIRTSAYIDSDLILGSTFSRIQFLRGIIDSTYDDSFEEDAIQDFQRIR